MVLSEVVRGSGGAISSWYGVRRGGLGSRHRGDTILREAILLDFRDFSLLCPTELGGRGRGREVEDNAGLAGRSR